VAGQIRQVLIKCGDPIRIIGDESVCRDGRTIVDLYQFISGLPSPVLEQGQDSLIDDLDYRGIWDRRPLEKELFTEHRLSDVEAPCSDRVGVDLAALDGTAGDLLHDSMPRTSGVHA
jgi:hypothetical protein